MFNVDPLQYLAEMNNTGQIDLSLTDEVAHITFSHPAHNSMPSHLLAGLVATLDRAGSNDAIRSILLRSGGERTFCAGANLDELLAIEDAETGKAFFMGFASVILAMRRCPKPIVVAVQGKAIGGGVGIAAAADYCLATTAAQVKLSELAIAIGPFVILPALTRKMGVAAASELCLDTEWHGAQWAKDCGLFQRVYNDTETLYTEAEALARKLANYSPKATSRLKKSLWSGTDHWPQLLAERARITGSLVLEDEAKKALEKFKSK
jgi:methylglutaconyl-CoA hydratase